MTAGALVLVSLATGGAVVLGATVPTWLFSSMNRGCLWRLRDEVYDARLDGRLAHVDAVDRLLDRIETLIVIAPKVSVLQLWWLRRRFAIQRSTEDPYLKAKDLNADEARLFFAFQYELARIVTRQYFFGSWSGLLLVVPRRLPIAIATLRQPWIPTSISPAPDSQSEQASAESSIAQMVEDALSHVRVAHDESDLVGAAG